MATAQTIPAGTPVPLPFDPGSPHPVGATPGPDGVNFSIFSGNATGVELLLFASHDAPEPFQTIRLDPMVNKTFHFWHVLVRGLTAGAHYAYPRGWAFRSRRRATLQPQQSPDRSLRARQHQHPVAARSGLHSGR